MVLVIAAVLALVALGVGFAIGHALGGAFVVIGLILGTYNARRLWTDHDEPQGRAHRRPQGDGREVAASARAGHAARLPVRGSAGGTTTAGRCSSASWSSSW